MHKLFSMCLFLFISLYMFRAHRAHHQERQIVSIQPLVTVLLYWWPRCVQVRRRLLPTCTLLGHQHIMTVMQSRLEVATCIVVDSTIFWRMRFLPGCLGFSLECHKTLDRRGDVIYWCMGFAFWSSQFCNLLEYAGESCSSHVQIFTGFEFPITVHPVIAI